MVKPQKPTTIDEYLANLSEDRRGALASLRDIILRIVPDAEPCISYSMPAFRLAGHVVAGFLATTKGCSYVPFSGTTLTTLAEDVASFSHTKSHLHFSPDRPLSVALVRKLLVARIQETREGKLPSRRGQRASAKKAQKRATTKRSPP